MKRLLSIALIFSIAAPFWISYSVIQYQKYSVKKEIKKQIINGMDKNDLVQFRFSKKVAETKLEWEHSKEFEYSGVMYDVVESVKKNDSVYYWCWEDDEETKLNQKLNALVEKTAGPDKIKNENLKQLSNFLSTLYNSFNNPFSFDCDNDSSNSLSYYFALYLSLTIEPQTPPPKHSSC